MTSNQTITTEASLRMAVMLSSHNGAEFIAAQIESILKQETDCAVSLFIRDDGSEDDTPAAVRKIIADCEEKEGPDVRFLFSEGPNLGYVRSYLALLSDVRKQEEADGVRFDYYAFCDQDDVWLPGKIDAAVSALRAEEQWHRPDPAAEAGKPSAGEKAGTHAVPVLWACRSALADEDLQPTGGTTQRDLRGISFYNTIVQNIAHGHNQVFNRSLFDLLLADAGRIDPQQIYAHDMWLMNLAAVRGTVFFDDTPRTLYRQHRNNELGFGKGLISWAAARVRRALHGETRRIGRQMRYFCHLHKQDLSAEELAEMRRFFRSEKTLRGRFSYIFRMKLYRQRRSESLALRLLYLLGAYNDLG